MTGLKGTTQVVTSALSIGRELWRYGEPELAKRALSLSPIEVLRIGARAGELIVSKQAAVLWPDGPRGSETLLAAVEKFEGASRPLRRRRRLPERALPRELQATLEERWQAAAEVADVMDVLHARGLRPKT